MVIEIDSLLNELRIAAKCTYISDLLSAHMDENKYSRIQRIPIERYSLEQWNAALAYVFGRAKCSFPSIQAAKESFSMAEK